MAGGRTDFFVSHAGSDRPWAEWVAWQLAEAGYSVELDVWDWATGQNFVTAMSDALDRCDRVVALFSAAYFERRRYTTDEWSASALHLPGTAEGRLVPVRLEDVPAESMPAVLRPLTYRDLFDLPEKDARRALLEAIAGPNRPSDQPVFPGRRSLSAAARPGDPAPRLPGSMPGVWNIPTRNLGFTGRDALLVAVREQLLAGHRAVVQALYGMGGVGKTQLAIEYAHRFAGTYDLAWWLTAEQPGLIGEQFAALAAQLGYAHLSPSTDTVHATVLRELRQRDSWLLIFDNADDPGAVSSWLPGGNGHVLITSRERKWTEIAAQVEIDVLARSESIAILRDRVDGLDEDADRLAASLGDLPLAIVQAASFMADTGTTAAEYMGLLRSRARLILGQGQPVSYPRTLASVIELSADQLANEDTAAAELASLCAFLAAEPIPKELLSNAAAALPANLADRLDDPVAWRQTLARLSRRALARLDRHGLQMHRLTQAVLRDRLTAEQAADTRNRVEAVLAAANPGDPSSPATWPAWARLMPHLLTADLTATSNPDLRQTACDACWYLVARGNNDASRDLAARLHQPWRQRLGSNDPHALRIARYLAWALREMGRYADARAIDEDTLARDRLILGEDHPDTLASATGLARDLRALGDVEAARDLNQDTLDRKRRVLGENDLQTLISAVNLATDLRALGEAQAAHDLGQDTLARCRRVLGENHPDTLAAANNLAVVLRALGNVQAAHDLDEDTLARCRIVLGESHPHTLLPAKRLANDLRAGQAHESP